MSGRFGRQLRGELLKLLARKRTYIGFSTFVAVEVLILGLLSLPKAQQAFERVLQRQGLAFAEGYTGLTLAVYIVIFTFVLRGLYLALVAGDLVAKEIEDGTIRLVLARPISRPRLFWIKALTNSLHAFGLMLFVGLTALLAAGLYRRGLGNLFVFAPHEGLLSYLPTHTGLARFGLGLLVMGLSYQVVAALGLMFSCCKMRPTAATVLTLSVLFVDFVLKTIPYFAAFERYFLSYHLAIWMQMFQQIIPWATVAASLALLGGLTVSFWIIGLAVFCTRDIKS